MALTRKFPYNNLSQIAYLCLTQSGLPKRSLLRQIFKHNTAGYWYVLAYHPERITVEQIRLIYSILGGKYSLPLLFALCAGYNLTNVPCNWYDDLNTLIPPQLAALERESILKLELDELKKK